MFLTPIYFHCPQSIFKDALILGSKPDYFLVNNLGGHMQDLAVVNVEAYFQLLPFHNLVGDAVIVRIQLKTLLGKFLHKVLVV